MPGTVLDVRDVAVNIRKSFPSWCLSFSGRKEDIGWYASQYTWWGEKWIRERGLGKAWHWAGVPGYLVLIHLVFKASLSDEVTLEQRFEGSVGTIQVTSGGKASQAETCKCKSFEAGIHLASHGYSNLKEEENNEIRESTGGQFVWWVLVILRRLIFTLSEVGSPGLKKGMTRSDSHWKESDQAAGGRVDLRGPEQGFKEIMHVEQLVQSLMCFKRSVMY